MLIFSSSCRSGGSGSRNRPGDLAILVCAVVMLNLDGLSVENGPSTRRSVDRIIRVLPSVRVGLGSPHAFTAGRCGFPDCRCLSAQSGQRVCPSMAVLAQSRQRPSSLRRWRSSAARTRLSSRFCSFVSLGFGARMALLRLTVPDPFLMVCLLTLRVRSLVLSQLAGVGRTKTCWRVLPIDRVCGGTRNS